MQADERNEQQTDARYLEALTRAVFATGFSERIVDRKWPGMREALLRFEVERVAELGADDLEELLASSGMIRNRAKLVATIRNAGIMRQIAAEHGSFAAWFDALPPDPVARRVAVAARFDRVGPYAAELFLGLLD
jgi:3-methyladenine DNA glycosylase Tag